MKIGIICAIEPELDALIDALDRPEKQTRHGFVFHTGVIGRHEVVLVQSGIGKVMAAIAVALLTEVFDIDAIINTGSAGALAPQLKVGDVVVADRLVYHDVDLTADGAPYGQMARQPLYYPSSKYFISELKKVAPSAKIGLIASGDSFLADPTRKANIVTHFPEVLAVEMEGASVAQAATALAKPFVVIRAISDTADHDATVSFYDFVKVAGKKSAETLIELLERMV